MISARRHPVHGVQVSLAQPTIIFLTVCTRHRQPWLGCPEVHELLRGIWQQANRWLVGQYVVMPAHIHLFAAPNREDKAPAAPVLFDNWVRYWKSQFTRRHNDPNHQWQSDHWDRRLRQSESYAEKWEYVRQNPVRHSLVASADQWPFQGKIHDLAW